MDIAVRQRSIDFLYSLIGQPLLYAFKSPDTEMYDFGFGELNDIVMQNGRKSKVSTHTLHALCRIKVIWKKSEQSVDVFYEDTPSEEFSFKIKCLTGLRVNRVALSEKNDLWIDFGDVWVVFATFENKEESWRYFTLDNELPHLIAADTWLDFS